MLTVVMLKMYPLSFATVNLRLLFPLVYCCILKLYHTLAVGATFAGVKFCTVCPAQLSIPSWPPVFPQNILTWFVSVLLLFVMNIPMFPVPAVFVTALSQKSKVVRLFVTLVIKRVPPVLLTDLVPS